MKRILLVFLSLLLLCSCTAENNKIEEPAFTVNGEEVSLEEVSYFEEKERTAVITKFIYEYSTEYDENFWNKEFDGITPRKYLDDKVKEEVIKAKIQLVLCRENNIYTDISYEGLYRAAVNYNNTHKDTQTVGINTINLDSFYHYYLDNGVMELKNILGETTLAPTQQEIDEEMVNVNKKFPDKTEEEKLLITKDILTENKYDKYIESLYKEAKIDYN